MLGDDNIWISETNDSNIIMDRREYLSLFCFKLPALHSEAGMAYLNIYIENSREITTLKISIIDMLRGEKWNHI